MLLKKSARVRSVVKHAPTVMNQSLYGMLTYHFGEVRITSEMEAMQCHYRKNVLTGEWQLDIAHPGEYYIISCPYCGDTRFRLRINHRWGVTDERGHSNLWLAHCHNERCLEGNPERRME